MYRLIKEIKRIDKVNKKIFWNHLKNYYRLTREFKENTNLELYKNKTIETPLYIFADNEFILRRINDK